MKDVLNLLVSLDENYLPQLEVLLTSIAVNNPGEAMNVYLMHSGMGEAALARAEGRCRRLEWAFHPVAVDEGLFQDAPVSRRYPKEMYYRLMAAHLLPGDVERILYLDPDILVINPLRPLWERDLEGNMFAAAAHTGMTEFANGMNRLRLGTDSDYYNSGVLLMDLASCRREILPEEVFSFAREHSSALVLPDQDILNALYGSRVLPLDDSVWNYDARNYKNYLLRSSGQWDLDWVISHTAVLHFCGRAKPWKPGYPYRFGILYKHYMQLAFQTQSL